MNTVESLKNSIKSAEDLGSVTRTMKTLAAVNIRQYEAAVESLSEYSLAIRTGLRMLLQGGVNRLNGDQQTGSRPGLIVFGSDQGMCGRFNEQVSQFAAEKLQGDGTAGSPVICVGHRAADSLRGSGVAIAETFGLPGSAEGITSLVHDLLPAMDRWRDLHHIERILVIHNRRQTASTWQPHATQLLPLNLKRLWQVPYNKDERPSRSLPFWTMEQAVLFSRFVRQYLFVSLFRACAESQAGENASRILAMQSADRSIRDRLQLLRTEYAQTRQTAITEELLDVVTGFEALQANQS